MKKDIMVVFKKFEVRQGSLTDNVEKKMQGYVEERVMKA